MQPDKKITALFYGMAACLLFLAGTLTYLQIFQGKKYLELALNNRIRRVALSAPRGVIYDRHGNVLVSNRPSYDVELVLDEVKDLARISKDLAEILKLEPEDILRRVRSGRYLPYLPVVVARDVGIEKLTRLVETRKNLSGINIAVRAVRSYPRGSLAAHVLGALGQISPGEYRHAKQFGYGPQDIIGKTGIEQAFNVQLVGKSGGMQVQVDSKGMKDKVLGYKIPVKGADLALTLDANLQKIVEDQLVGKIGAAVVLDVPTGEILAMASAPTFDPSAFVESAKRKEREAILKDRKRPLVNRAISGVYPPGSVMKTVVGLAGLESEAIQSDTRYYCPGEFQLGDTKFHCWRKHGHGTVDLEEALKYSCNVFFYRAGLQTGQEKIQAMARAFGLGERTGFLLQAEYAGLLPTKDWKRRMGLGGWRKGDTVNLSIGQGYALVTPIQMVSLGVCLGSSGIWRTPMIVRKDPRFPPFAREVALDKKNLKKIQQGMIRVVNDRDGTGYSGHLDNFVVAGKTGTVQTRMDRTSKKDHAWFVGFAPADDPRVAVAVIVEGAGSGGIAAAPVAKEIFKAALGEGMATSLRGAQLRSNLVVQTRLLRFARNDRNKTVGS